MSTISNSSFQLDATRTQSIIAARAIVKSSQQGDTVRFHIQGNGNTIPVTTKDGAQVMDNNTGSIPLMKTIYNVRANSHIAMLNPLNRQILRDAMKAESDGDVDKAHTLFNQYLNKIQVSFSMIINPSRKTEQFYNQQLVEGEVDLITTENGQLISMKNVRPVRVEKLASTPTFSLADLMGLDEQPAAEDVFVPEGAAAVETKQ